MDRPRTAARPRSRDRNCRIDRYMSASVDLLSENYDDSSAGWIVPTCRAPLQNRTTELGATARHAVSLPGRLNKPDCDVIPIPSGVKRQLGQWCEIVPVRTGADFSLERHRKLHRSLH